ncbi:hypothetical protein LTR15_012967 [Elasticomyces elasticus]|nr:hypothetical protein LTR15_012967 [Elasticomyces elasticus]
MDPASAIGVAAAVLQFLEFSVKVLKTCKEIRDDANSATQNNKELEKAARILEDFRAELGSVMRSKQANRRIVTIAYECAQTAKELIDLLEYIRGGDGKLGTAKATWRAMLKRKPIERLQRSLQERETVLDKVLNQDTNTNVQALREDVRKLGLGNRASVDHLSTKLSSLSLATNKRIGTAERNIHRRFDNVERSTQQSRDAARQQQDYERFLSSLFFPEIDQRRSTVKAAYPDTFQWIFNLPDASDSFVPGTRETANFASWLRADASVYWISGKAGSGKSTLMAFILDDPRTREALQMWSSDLPVHLLSFFFWRAGSELQKSVIGLLRSILYQLCQCIPDAINTIGRQLNVPAARLPTWTESTLTDAIKATISATTKARFCLFVDGLDELVGNHDDLVDLIFDLQAFDHIKCCVSSRPEIELYVRLVECQCLRLQDLNWSDIQVYVSAKLAVVLQDGDRRKDLISAVVHNASGVFLWAVLVTQSIVRGHKSGDDWEVLQDHVNHMPRDLEALFAQMVDDIHPVHRGSLAFYLQSMKLMGSEPYLSTIALLTASRDPLSMQSYSGFVTACQQTELQVLGQSAGLLEIWSGQDLDLERHLSNTTEPVVFVPGSCKEADRARLMPDPSSVLLYTEILRFEHLTVQWIHRSAFEYVFPPDNATSKPMWWAGDTVESAHRLMRGTIELCWFGPSFILPNYDSSSRRRIAKGVHLSCALIKAGQVTEAIRSLDELRAELKQLHCSEIPLRSFQLGSAHDSSGVVYSFWTTAATQLTEPKGLMYSVVLPGLVVHLIGNADQLDDYSYVASYAPGLTDLQFDARVDPDFYFTIASAAILFLEAMKFKNFKNFDVATWAALRDLCELVETVMKIIKMNVSMLTRTPHCGLEDVFTLQIPWRPLAMSLLEEKRPFENDEVHEFIIIYIPVTEPRREREVFHQSILFRLRHETSKLLASMLAWETEDMVAWKGRQGITEKLCLRICNHDVDALQAMMLADIEANEQCLSVPQQHLLSTAIKTRLCEFYLGSESMPKIASRAESTQSHQIVI